MMIDKILINQLLHLLDEGKREREKERNCSDITRSEIRDSIKESTRDSIQR